ncbi:lamin tail domain-containing protein [Halobacterium wangiae]|uniref:lamin tail domain-containing protein n=1 Tax=Halobacterium wangiae TaxID=2902623 RepID=UPI001E59ED3B|nr:lamin tail domain-containing protein [Halobacterium wangiae]
MTDNTQATFRVVTAHDQIRKLADDHGVSPRVVERPDDTTELRIETPPGAGDATSWDAFFERFDDAEQVVLYRPPEPRERENPVFDVVGRDVVGIGRDDEPPDEPSGGDTEPVATGDTGDHEPVAYDHAGSEAGRETDEPEDASVSSAADTEHGPTDATEGLVLDEIHGTEPGTGRDLDDEYLVFENDGGERLDLSGWTVHNDEGRSYRFPEGTTLAPGEQVTLHSGSGRDTADHRYWDADDAVWGGLRDTVTVETPTGERVLRVSYEG